MKSIHTDKPLFKALNILLLYAFGLNVLVPGTQAYAAIGHFTERTSFSSPLEGLTTLTSITSASFAEEVPAKEQHASVRQAARSQSASAGGPGQTESSGFSLGSMDGIVDPFTGDFSYAIPLMDVEGYPIVISYNSNVGMLDEASWVGLGWNLNVGSVAREMRGIPDEFDGNQAIARTYNVKTDSTKNGSKYGAIGGFSYRTPPPASVPVSAGIDLRLLWGNYYNTYLGEGKTFDFGLQAKFGYGISDNLLFGPAVGLGYSRNSKTGIGRSSNVGMQLTYGKPDGSGPSGSLGLSWGGGFNSRYGVTQRGISASVAGGYSMKGDPENVSDKNAGAGGSAGSSFGSTFTCGSLTAIPRMELRSRYDDEQTIVNASVIFNTGAGFRFSIGGEIQDYKAAQQLYFSDYTDQIIYDRAFGYLHSAKRDAFPRENAIMDYNRERGQQFSSEMKNLPFSFPTYDVFYANASGLGATFRANRPDAGVYHDDIKSADQSGSTNEFGAGVIVTPSVGFELSYTGGASNVSADAGHWESGSDVLKFGDDANVYFKGIGEPTPHSSALLDEVFGTEPVFLNIQPTGETILKTNDLVSKSGAHNAISSGELNTLNGREIFANIYKPLTAGAIGGKYPSLEYNTFVDPATDSIARVDGPRAENHLSVVDITTSAGMHYRYGNPAYTLQQSEVMFSIGQTTPSVNGLVIYAPGDDNSIDNDNGRANLFDKTTVPAFAHSFLLTEATSSDYVDRTNNGPTIDDIGSYYKISHTRLYDESDPFKTRFPMGEDSAFYDPGLLATELDDIANYTYTEKEIWYTHSVESRNYIAEFVLEDRVDAYGVEDENGARDETKPLKRLKAIVLYNRGDRLANGVNAKPLQTVEFEYDYSLCRKNPANGNTPGANDGKLTLKAIRVYSGPVSQETALAPYLFTYSDNNPNFNYRNVDRWGNYKPNDPAKSNDQFPYAEQDPIAAHDNITAWKLVKIFSPMGAEMEVTYAADSYSCVQNKRAMEHLEIKGYTTPYELAYLCMLSEFDEGTTRVSNAFQRGLPFMSTVANLADDISPGWAAGAAGSFASVMNLVNGNGAANDLLVFTQNDRAPANVIIFELQDTIQAGSREAASVRFRDQYLNANADPDGAPNYLKEIYLKNRTNIRESLYDVIPTFAQIRQDDVNFTALFPFDPVKTTGVLPPGSDGAYHYGYIVLETVSAGEKESFRMSPIQKTALEFARLHLADKVYGACPDCESDLTIDQAAFWRGEGLYKLMGDIYCRTMVPGLSTIRCFDHDNFKFGGNAKVTEVVYRDNWNQISGEFDTEYSWLYTTGDSVSTQGVASYEPRVGADENPFYQWSRFTNKSVSFPDETQFTVEPIGESLFPGAVVGYSESELTLGGTFVNGHNSLGRSVSRFLTAREKPTVFSSTAMDDERVENTRFLNTEVDIYGFSQGHVVITNDFHGKPLEHEVFDRAGNSQYLTRYTYKKLMEPVAMLDREGTVHQDAIAWEYDVYADARFTHSDAEVIAIGLGVNILLGPPFFFPFLTGAYNKRLSGFYTHTLNKHINYSAVADSVVTTSLGSQNTALNLVYDRYSGATLLSSLQDEFNDPLFAFSYPSHWYHEDLQSPALQPTATVSGTINLGQFTYASYLGDLFSVGDLVTVVVGAGSPVTGNVLEITDNKMRLINHQTGKSVPSSTNQACTVTLRKSNRKNRLVETMQSFTTKRSPFDGSTFTFPDGDLIDAGAISYKRRYNLLCVEDDEAGRFVANAVVEGDTINPFLYGVMRDLLPEHQFAPQVERNSSEVQGIRFNGTLTDNDTTHFSLFYRYNTTTDRWYKIDEPGHPDYAGGNLLRWRASGEVFTMDEYGKPLDGLSQIKVPSAVQYGYNRMHKIVPVAQAVNALQHQIGFDSFEDYDYLFPGGAPFITDIAHFDFTKALLTSSTDLTITGEEQHSGMKSLKINKSNRAQLIRPVTDPEMCAEPLDDFTGTQEFIIDSCNCIKPFAPTPGIYTFGAWVKGTTLNLAAEYANVYVEINLGGSAATYELRPSGQLIDGWQRIEGEFEIPDTATTIEINLVNDYEEDDAYFDDVRVHPFLAGMTTTVYHPDNLLPMATHDGYNFTTFYIYDENLQPVSIRVETIDGIKTVSTVEGSTIKTYE